jgi:hypothetical protein
MPATAQNPDPGDEPTFQAPQHPRGVASIVTPSTDLELQLDPEVCLEESDDSENDFSFDSED